MSRTLNEVKTHIINSFLSTTNREKEPFCKKFALIARFSGWRWGFCKDEIPYDSICATYESLVSACLNRMQKLSDDDLRGNNFTVSCGTGRINICMTYYVSGETVMTDVTADIS